MYRLGSPIEKHPNYQSFVAASNVCTENGIDPREYIRAQFADASSDKFPYPNNLASRTAVSKWRKYVSRRDADAHVAQMQRYLQQYKTQLEMPEDEVVLIPTVPFDSWFRVWYMRVSPSEALKELARREMKNRELRKAVENAGYDLLKLERRIDS